MEAYILTPKNDIMFKSLIRAQAEPIQAQARLVIEFKLVLMLFVLMLGLDWNEPSLARLELLDKRSTYLGTPFSRFGTHPNKKKSYVYCPIFENVNGES